VGKPTGFMEYERRTADHVDPAQRIGNFDEFKRELDDAEREAQGARCMDCGVPFCQSSFGCPVDNLIPEWNDLIYHGEVGRSVLSADEDEQLSRVHRAGLSCSV
jgi:glutamate synthase (NADPH/NADH) small chain